MKKTMLCNPDMVRDIIYSTNSGYSFDNPKFLGAIAQASEQIASYTRRRFTYGQHTDVFDIPANYDGLFRIYTTGIPLDISDGEPRPVLQSISGANAALVLSTLVVLDSDLGIAGVRTVGSKTTIALRYNAGYKPLAVQPSFGEDYVFLDVPYSLMNACAVQASFIMQRQMRNETGKRGDEGSTVAKEAVYGIAPDAAKVINTLVRPRYMGAR